MLRWSSKLALVSLALVLALGLVYAQTRMPTRCVVAQSCQDAPSPLPAPVQMDVESGQVQLRCMIVKIDESFFEGPAGEAWADLAPKACKNVPQIVHDEVARRFWCAVQSQKCGDVIASPTIITLDGQPASITTGETLQWVENIAFEVKDGKTVPQLNSFKVHIGTGMTFNVKRNAVCSSCDIEMTATHSTLCNDAPTSCDVTIKIKNENDEVIETRHETVRPRGFCERRCRTLTSVPEGRCALMYFDRREADESGQHWAVIVTPYVAESSSSCIAVTAACCSTPASRADQSCCQARCAARCCGNQLQSLMSEYRRACHEQRMDDARRLAKECLEIDPACFVTK